MKEMTHVKFIFVKNKTSIASACTGMEHCMTYHCCKSSIIRYLCPACIAASCTHTSLHSACQQPWHPLWRLAAQPADCLNQYNVTETVQEWLEPVSVSVRWFIGFRSSGLCCRDCQTDEVWDSGYIYITVEGKVWLQKILSFRPFLGGHCSGIMLLIIFFFFGQICCAFESRIVH